MADGSQQEHLERVTAKIGRHVLTFCTLGRRFHMDDLVTFVQAALGTDVVAPDSSSRVLRALRRERLVNYRVLSRKDSYYEVLPMTWNENQYDPATIKDSWGTPDNVLEPIYQHFGQIGLDPCANAERLLNAKHSVTQRSGDGLATMWDGHGLVYVNPPYFDCAPWAHKAATEGDEVISLLPARTGAKWFQKWVVPADVLLFWKGRIKFHGAKDIAPFHMTLSYWGPRPELFLTAFPDHWYVKQGGGL